MPHGINYIHGAAHYNSGILLFNDFADGIGHFSDPRFRAEVAGSPARRGAKSC